jgi:hypothetical protein
MFKNDTASRPEAEFLVLDRLFGDVDAFCSDPTIRGPDDLDEDELRNKCREAFIALQTLPSY